MHVNSNHSNSNSTFYNVITRNIERIEKEIDSLSNEVSDSVKTKHIDKQIQELNHSLKIVGSQVRLLASLPTKNPKNLTEVENFNHSLTKLNKRITCIVENLPKIFIAAEKRTIFVRLFHLIEKILLRPLDSVLSPKLFLGAIQKKKIQKLFAKEEALLVEKDKLEKDSTLSSPSLRLEKINQDIEKISKKCNKYRNFATKSAQMHLACQKIGGKRITLNTADNMRLDGMFLNAQEFRKKLSQAGCKQVTIPSQDEKGLPKDTQGLFISHADYAQSGEKIIEALKKLNAFAAPSLDRKQNSVQSIGWSLVTGKEGVYIISTSELPTSTILNEKYEKTFVDHPLFSFNAGLNRWEIKDSLASTEANFVKKDLDITIPPSSTIILTGGALGVYEQNKKEMMFFLLQNVNVMTFNYRGYGNSEGTPSIRGLRLDMEAAYQYVKANTAHKDNQITAKGLCMSGPFVAYLGKKHPEINIIVDQSFFSLQKAIKLFIENKIIEKVSAYVNSSNSKGITRISKKLQKFASFIGYLISKLAPKLNLAETMAKNKGAKAIFYTHGDEIIDSKNVTEIIHHLSKKNNLNKLTVISGPGEHAESLISISASRVDFAEKELIHQTEKLQALMKEIINLEHKVKDYEIKIKTLTSQLKANKKTIKTLIADLSSSTKINEETKKSLEDRIEENVQLTHFLKRFKNKLNQSKAEKKRKKYEAQLIEYNLKELQNNDQRHATGQNQLKEFLRKNHLMSSILP